MYISLRCSLYLLFIFTLLFIFPLLSGSFFLLCIYSQIRNPLIMHVQDRNVKNGSFPSNICLYTCILNNFFSSIVSFLECLQDHLCKSRLITPAVILCFSKIIKFKCIYSRTAACMSPVWLFMGQYNTSDCTCIISLWNSSHINVNRVNKV